MNLYLLTRTDSTSYDDYDSAVVAAENEAEAKLINPDTFYGRNSVVTFWCQTPDQVEVKLIGIATPDTQKGIVLVK